MTSTDSHSPVAGATPGQTHWAERTVYVYDDGSTDPGTGYSLPQGERAGPEVQEWTNVNGTPTQADFTHSTYDAATGQPASIASSEKPENGTVTISKVLQLTRHGTPAVWARSCSAARPQSVTLRHIPSIGSQRDAGGNWKRG